MHGVDEKTWETKKRHRGRGGGADGSRISVFAGGAGKSDTSKLERVKRN